MFSTISVGANFTIVGERIAKPTIPVQLEKSRQAIKEKGMPNGDRETF